MSLIKILNAIPGCISSLDLSNNAWDTSSGPDKIIKLLAEMPDHISEVVIGNDELYSKNFTKTQIDSIKEAVLAFKARHSPTPFTD